MAVTTKKSTNSPSQHREMSREMQYYGLRVFPGQGSNRVGMPPIRIFAIGNVNNNFLSSITHMSIYLIEGTE